MSRPRKGEPGHEEASKRWKQTMLKKYGSEEALHKHLQEMGAKGGSHGVTGGFASNRALARIAGAMGGRVSKRGYKLVGEKDGQKIYRKDGKDYTIEDVKAELEAKYGKRS